MPVNPFRRGGPDVPVLDGGTGASVAATALSNLGGLDETAHDLLDHTGLTGIGDLTTLTHASIDHSVVPATFFNVGTTTLATANGDLAAGDSTNYFIYDNSGGVIGLDRTIAGATSHPSALVISTRLGAGSGAGNGFGSQIVWQGTTNAPGFQTQGSLEVIWADAASTIAEMVFRVKDGIGNFEKFTLGGAGARFHNNLRIGASTGAVADGDFSAGDGTREMFWDASAAILEFATTSTIRANGAGLDLTFGARGATYNLNDAGNTVLTTVNQTIIGALNELVSGGGSGTQIEQTYGNDTGGAISANRLVAPDFSGGGANDIALADATTSGVASNLVGVSKALISNGGTGQVVSYGRVAIAWVGGETKPANGVSVYLSTTAGLATSVPPATPGNVVHHIGYVTDNTGLSATTIAGETATVSFFIDGSRIVA